MDKIIIYTSETCPYCKKLQQELKNKNIKFTNKPIKEFKSEWQSVVELTGIPSMPTVKYNDEYFVPNRDFNSPQNLIELLKNFKESSFSEEKQLIEMIKTLSYNILMAFQRKLLHQNSVCYRRKALCMISYQKKEKML